MNAFRIALLFLAVGAAVGLNLCIGDVWLSPRQAWSTLFASGNDALRDSGINQIIWEIRLPRLLVAAVVGISLSVSGYVLQALSRNYLADPYLTGTSSGAGLAVAVALFAGADFALLPPIAFIGGFAASITAAILARSPAGLSISKLLLAGVALSAFCGGLITLLLTTSKNQTLSQVVFFWLAGGISGRSWSELIPSSAYVGLAVAAVFVLSKPLRLLSLGQQAATSLGLNVSKAQSALLVCAIVLCGAAVSLSGLVGFVGLIAPHLARSLFGRDERIQIIASALIGATLVLASDLAARTLGQGQELPLGTLLSLVGGPFFLWQVFHRKGEAL
jgi:iron complex transport system permease protein